MTEKILLIGDDALLLKTRALVLGEWQPVTATSFEAPDIVASQEFDLIIIGQSVNRERAEALIESVRTQCPSPDVLLIRFSNELDGFLVETHDSQELRHPDWLRSLLPKF